MAQSKIKTPTSFRLTDEELKILDRLPGESRTEKISNLLAQQGGVEAVAQAIYKGTEGLQIQMQMLLNEVQKNASKPVLTDSQPVPNGDHVSREEFRRTMARFAELFAMMFYSVANPKSADDKVTTAGNLKKEIASGAFGDDIK